jgi:hypothetical protein
METDAAAAAAVKRPAEEAAAGDDVSWKEETESRERAARERETADAR